MDNFDSTASATAAGIEAEFAGRWAMWLSDSGQWWAARRQALSAEDLAVGCVPYPQADSLDELRNRVRDEEALTTRHKTHQASEHFREQPDQPENTDDLWKSWGNGHQRNACGQGS